MSGPGQYHRPQYQPHYIEAPEPIIEIIIQDSNETLPAPPPIHQPVSGKRKKEQVQVFYVKYQKDDKNGLVIHDPVAALSPTKYQQEEDDSHEEEHLTIVTPIPQIPVKTTTIRTIIRPESEQYEAPHGIHVTFGSQHNHHSKSDVNIQEEKKEESAIQPVVAIPQNRVDFAPPFKQTEQFPFQGQSQGRIVNNFNQGPPTQNFNSPQPQSNFVNPPPFLSTQLTLPHQNPPKLFNPNFPPGSPAQAQLPIRPSQPAPVISPPQQNFNRNPFTQNGPQQQFPPRSQQFPQAQPLIGGPPPQSNSQFSQGPIGNLRPPVPNSAPTFNTNFNAQRPFNHHAHRGQIPQQQPNPNPQFSSQNSQFQQLNQRPQRPVQIPPQNFNQQPPLSRPPINFNTQFPPQQPPQIREQPRPQFNQPFTNFPPPPTPQQQPLTKQQPQVPQFRPMPHQQSAPPRFSQAAPPVQQFNQQYTHHQHVVKNQNFQQSQFNDQNVFRGGGLVEQTAPNLATATPALHFQQPKLPEQHPPASFQRPQHSQSLNHAQNLQSVQGLVPNGGEIQNSEVRFEHHITETINSPILYETHSINMDLNKQNSGQNSEQQQHHHQHRFNVNQGGVSNLFSDVFPSQREERPGSFLNVDPRNNFKHASPTATTVFRPTTIAASRSPATAAPTTTTTTPRPIASNVVLPDEVPDDLRQQLIDSGILANAQISILDYDKIGETPLDQLPPEHLANFFSAGGGAQIASSNRIVSVVKPNGDSIDEKIKSIKSDPEISKILENAKKLPSKKEDVNLKVVRFDADNEKSVSNQYIKQDSTILPSVNINQNYNRYLPLKINGAHFPIPDVEELKGKKISSVVVLAPVDSQQSSEETRVERDLIDTKQIEFVAGDVLKQLLKKPSSENFKKWLEKESKTEADLQSVILLVTK